ncbi:MAG: hypothetical protein IMY72_13065 [Bacteroidetes bacterium]|nr:hypothetical protein [Bacteroidota bacterium]
MRYYKLVLKRILYALIIFLTSCDFSPSDVYYFDVKEPTVSPILKLELNIDNTESLIYYWNSSVKLSLKNENIKIQSVDFFLDNEKLITLYDGVSYSAHINLYDYKEHSFRIEFYTTTGSNSIADNIGAESFKFGSREWILVPVNYNIYDNGSITLTKDGATIDWKAFDGIGFNHYRIFKGSTNTEFISSENTLIDNEYLGEDERYYVYVVDVDGKETLWAQCRTFNNLPSLKIIEKNRKPALTWTTTGYESKIKFYKIYSKYLSSWDYLGEVKPDEGSFILNGLLHGASYRIRLDAIPVTNYNITNISLFSKYLDADIGVSGPKIDNLLGNCMKGFVFEYRDTTFFYSAENNNYEVLLNDNNFFKTVSPNLKYFLLQKGTTIELYSLENFEFIKSVNIKNIISDYSPAQYPKISDNGLVEISVDKTVYLYDIINEYMLTSKKYDRFYNPVLSPDGRYLLLYDENVLITNEISGNSIVELNKVTKTDGWYGYDDFFLIPDEPDKVYSYENQYLTVRTMTDYSEQRKFYAGSHKYLGGIDFSNDKVLIYGAEKFFIYDFNSGNLLETIPMRVYVSSNTAAFCNNIIFTSGFKYYLNQK